MTIYRRKPRGSVIIRFDLEEQEAETTTSDKLDLSKYSKISNSRISRWNTCKRAHHYAFNEKLERKTPPAPLYKGKIIHECIEELINDRDWRPILEKYTEEYNNMFEEEKAEYGDLPTELRIIMEGYEKRYEDDGLTYLEKDGKKAEHEIQLVISEEAAPGSDKEGIVYVGKIDAIAQDEQDRVWLMDHKTFKKLPDEDFRWTNQQVNLYTWAMPQIGFPKPDGVIWDYIRTKVPTKPKLLKSGELSKNKNIDTTYETYYNEIIANGLDPADYEEFLESLKENEDNFYRRITLPTRENIIQPIVEDMINTAKEIHYLGETLKSRNLGRHCTYCPFKQICQVELMGGDSEFIKKSEYRPSTYHVNVEEE